MQQHLNRRSAESVEYLSHLQLSHSKYGGDESSVQRMSAYSAIANSPAPIQRQAAPQGGLPANLKSGIESLSGIAMDDVRVHYNSSKPAQLQAHAYAQGTDIHIAPGQERHLPHEAWHVVQQKQGRVKPTLQLKGVAINDDSALEREADVMGGRALQAVSQRKALPGFSLAPTIGNGIAQLRRRSATVAWDTTHEVIPDANGSLFGDDKAPFGNEGKELKQGDRIEVDDEEIFQSRRGANQELPARREEDAASPLNKKWVKLKKLGTYACPGYVREETIAYDREDVKRAVINYGPTDAKSAREAATNIHAAWGAARDKRRMSTGAWEHWETTREEKDKETSPAWDQIEEGFDVSHSLSKPATATENNYSVDADSNQSIISATDSSGAPIGMIVIEKRSTNPFPLHDDDPDFKWYIRWLIGHPTAKGAGSELLARALNHAKGSGGKGVWVESAPSAVAWYRSKGFLLMGNQEQKDNNDSFEQGWDSELMFHAF